MSKSPFVVSRYFKISDIDVIKIVHNFNNSNDLRVSVLSSINYPYNCSFNIDYGLGNIFIQFLKLNGVSYANVRSRDVPNFVVEKYLLKFGFSI